MLKSFKDFFKEDVEETLYVRRDVLNHSAIVEWAKEQGFKETLEPEKMHATIAFSRKKLDWNNFGLKFDEVIIKGGKRSVVPLGDEGAVVLKFESDVLHKRWEQFIKCGASWDYDSYQPHVTITYNGKGIDLKSISAYNGDIILGKEKAQKLDLNWKDKVKHK